MWRGRQYCNPNCKVTLARKTQNNVAVDRVTDPSSMSSSSWPLIQLQFTANCCCLFQWRHDISNYVGCCCYSYFYMRACIGLIEYTNYTVGPPIDHSWMMQHTHMITHQTTSRAASGRNARPWNSTWRYCTFSTIQKLLGFSNKRKINVIRNLIDKFSIGYSNITQCITLLGIQQKRSIAVCYSYFSARRAHAFLSYCCLSVSQCWATLSDPDDQYPLDYSLFFLLLLSIDRASMAANYNFGSSRRRYEWNNNYAGGVAPRDLELEKELFGEESHVHTGINFSKYDSIKVKVLGDNPPPGLDNVSPKKR